MNRNIVLIFILFLLALPLASAQINDTVLYLPFETTVGEIASQPVIYDLFISQEGHVTANDSTKYNYGWNGSIQRNGTGNAGLITLESSPQITYTAFSWNGWFKDDATDSDWAYWSAYDQNSGSEYPMMMNCYDASPCNKIQYSIATSSGTYSDTYAYTPSSTTWGMWTWTYDGSNMRLYRNGAEVDSVAATGTIDVEALLLSIRRQGTGTYQGAGKPTMDDVSFWNETLNTTQITELYNGGAGKRVDEVNFSFDATWYSSMDTLMSQNAIYDNAWSAGTYTLDQSYPFAFTPVAVPGIIDQADLTARSYFVKDFSPGTYASQADSLPSWSDLGISSGDTLSISLWFKPSDQDSQSFLLGGETGSNGFQLNYYTEGVYIGSGAGSFGTSSWIYGVTANEWHLATLTFDSATTTWNLTIDNGDVGSTTFVKDWAYASSAYSLMIGADYHETAAIPAEKGFTGSLQDFTLYDYVLTGANVNSIWQSGAPTQLASEVLGSSGITYNDSLTYKTGNALEWGRANNGPRMIAPAETALEIDDSSITIAAWGKKVPPGGGASDVSLIFLNGRDEGYNGAYKMYISGDDDFTLGCYMADFDAVYAATPDDGTQIRYGEWAHYVCVFDYDTKTLYRYVNGVSSGANTSAASVSWDRLPTGYTNQIGGRLTAISGDYDNWEGFLDEVRVYNRSLNSTEVLELYNYNQFSGEPTPQTCEVSYNDFNNTPGNWTLYYPFDYSSDYTIGKNGITGSDGIVNANTSTAWNYGYNGSIDFDGANDYIELEDSLSGFAYDDAFTTAFWVQTEAKDEAQYVARFQEQTNLVMTIDDTSLTDEPQNKFCVVMNDGSWTDFCDPSDMEEDTWVHYTVTYNNTGSCFVEIFKNGVAVNNISASCPSSASNNLNYLSDASSALKGKLDEFVIYNHILNQSEITELYNLGAGKRADETNFYNESKIAYYNDMDFLMGPGPNGYAGTGPSDLYQHTTGVPGIIGAGEQNENNWNLTAQGFNGINDYIELGTISELVGTGDRTITFWVRPRDIGTTNNYFFAQGDQTDNEWFGIFLDAGGELEFSTYGTGDFSTGTTLVDNTWYHIAFTYDGSETIAYVDGADVYTDSYSTLNVGTDNTPILMYSPNAAFYSAGDMQDFNAYDEALSPAQITSIYQSGTPTQLIRDVYSTDLVYNNSLTYSTGTSLGFDGTSDRFEVLNDVPFPTIAGLTYSTWYWYPSTASSYEDFIFWHGDATTPNVKFFLSRKTDQTLRFQIAGATGHRFDVYSNGTTLQSGQWNHILINGSGIGEAGAPYQMWINGVKVTDCNGAPDASPCDVYGAANFPPAADEPFWLGAENDGATANYLEGKLDDFRFYNRSMNATEIAAIYNHGQLSFTSDGSCVTTFGTTVDPTTVYTVDSMTCTALWESNDDPTAPTSVNFTQTWFNESLVYSQFNQTGAADGQIYNLIVPSAATLYNQNWSCEVNWTYNPTLSQSVNRTIQNSLPVLAGNFTWSEPHNIDLERTFTCTDPDTTQNLTLFIADNQSDFYGAGTTVDLSSYTSILHDVKYIDSFWYVLDDTNNQVIKFNSSWQWEANYSLANSNPSGFYLSGDYWYVTDNTDDKVYQYNLSWNDTSNTYTTKTNPWDLYFQDVYWYVVSNDGGAERINRYFANWTEDTSFSEVDIGPQDINPRGIWFWNNSWYMVGTGADKVWKYNSSWGDPQEQYDLGYDPFCIYRSGNENAPYWYICNVNENIDQYYSNFTSYVNINQTGLNTTVNGIFNHTLSLWDTGNHYINITCNDTVGHTDSGQFFINLTNSNPTIPTTISPNNGYSTFSNTTELLCNGSTDANNDTISVEFWSYDSDGFLLTTSANVSYERHYELYGFYPWYCRATDELGYSDFIDYRNLTYYSFSPNASCTTGTLVYNFTLYDEGNRSDLNGSMQANFNFTGINDSFMYFIDQSNQHEFDVCISPNLTMEMETNAFIQYEATDYDARNYFIVEHNVSPATAPYEIPLYLLEIDDATLVNFNVLDSSGGALVGVYLYVERYIPEEDGYFLATMGLTNDDGETSLYLRGVTTPDVWYRFKVYQNTELVWTTEPARIFNANVEIRVGATTWLDISEPLEDVTGELSLINYTFVGGFSTYSGAPRTVCLNVIESKGGGRDEQVYYNCQTAASSTSGTLQYTIADTNNPHRAYLQTYTQASPLNLINLLMSAYAVPPFQFGAAGVLIAFGIILIMGLLGSFHPASMVALVMVAVSITTFGIGMVTASTATIMGVLILGLLVLVRSKL